MGALDRVQVVASQTFQQISMIYRLLVNILRSRTTVATHLNAGSEGQRLDSTENRSMFCSKVNHRVPPGNPTRAQLES